MDGLMFDVENRSARTRPAGKSAQPLQLSSGGFPASAGKQMQTPRRRALGDITNGRSNTPSNTSKTPGVSMRKPLAQAATAVTVHTAVEEVDTAKRMGEEEEPFTDAWFEEGMEALNKFAASQTNIRSSRIPLLPPAPPPPTPCFEPESSSDRFGEDEDGEMDKVLEEDGEGGAFDDFTLDLPCDD